MRDVAATGDLTRKVAGAEPRLGRRGRAAAGVARSTRSPSRSRASSARRRRSERLSSLGRLSTVIAHEIRNPLMIIRASLCDAARRRGRRRAERARSGRRHRRRDARASTASSPRCSTSPSRSGSTWPRPTSTTSAARRRPRRGPATPDGDVRLDLDPDCRRLVTDAERLRTALVNILANARHAVEARRRAPATAARRQSARRRRRRHRSSTARPERVVDHRSRDRGVGIAPEDMAHIFDPYFTTRRAGHRPRPADRQEHHRGPRRHASS